MPMWLRIVLLILVAVWSFYRGMKIEDRVQTALVKASGGSALRAAGIAVGYHVAIVGALGLFGIAAAIAHAFGPAWLTIMILLAGLASTTPYMWCLAPGQAPFAPPTAFRDLRRHNASKPVARALGYTSVAMFFIALATGPFAAGAAVLIIGG